MAPPDVTASRSGPAGRSGCRGRGRTPAAAQFGELGGRVLAGEQVQRRLERAAWQRRERRAAPHRVEPAVGVQRFQRGRPPRCAGPARRADWSAPAWFRSARRASAARSPRSRSGPVRCLGNSTPWEISPTWWPARPMRCRPLATDGGDHLDDQVDRAHVDAQLEAGSGDHGLQPPALEVVLNGGALPFADRAVMARASSGGAPGRLPTGHDVRRRATSDTWVVLPVARRRSFGVNLVEPRGKSLGQPPRIGEHDGRTVRLDQVDDALLDVGPDRCFRLAMSGTGTCTDRSKANLAAGGATIVVGASPDRNLRHLLGWADGCGQPDPLRRGGRQPVETLQRRQMRHAWCPRRHAPRRR